jgi:hypothetical protein
MKQLLKTLRRLDYEIFLLGLIPIVIALCVWLSPLAFVPVPWPDDSAFYFVARELFKWPPRWVMLPQAPFEPTYRIFNFNTMPLYPILIGLGRFIGIDGSFLLKIWPLSSWALSGSLLVTVLYRFGLPFTASALLAFVYALDPELRWASVLVRPESLIGLFGMALVLGLTFGFPKKWRPRGLWDPVAALLVLAAYAHFNAIHLVFPVLFAFATQPRRLVSIGATGVLYLSPWILSAIFHWQIFTQQMFLQWSRLSGGNGWLETPQSALTNLFQSMGSPDSVWPDIVNWAAFGMWIIFGVAMLSEIIIPGIKQVQAQIHNRRKKKANPRKSKNSPNLLPAAGWILGSIWLFHNKPEVWFIYYFHTATWCFTGLLALKLWKSNRIRNRQAFFALATLVGGIALIFAYVDEDQARRLGASESWHWSTYYDFVGCVDQRLTELENTLGKGKPFHVWCPTFPDITVELSRKHPHWELTRTNDFWSRQDLAIQHAHDAEAVVVTETIGWTEQNISSPAEKVPGVQSSWMLWTGYFLNRLWIEPHWKPNRYICQRGRWQAFIFMK